MNGLYTIDELTNSIIDEFQLNMSDYDAYDRYYQRIYRALASADILKNGIEMTNPITHRKCRYYTEQHKQTILAQKGLFNYVRNNSASDEIRNGKRYDDIKDEIELRRNNHIKYLTARSNEDNDKNLPKLSQQDFRDYKMELMLTALFEKFFSPINEELLFNDLYRKKFISDDIDLEIEDLEAEKRLQHPNGSYFHALDV